MPKHTQWFVIIAIMLIPLFLIGQGGMTYPAVKYDGNAAHYLDGSGAFSTPAGTASGLNTNRALSIYGAFGTGAISQAGGGFLGFNTMQIFTSSGGSASNTASTATAPKYFTMVTSASANSWYGAGRAEVSSQVPYLLQETSFWKARIVVVQTANTEYWVGMSVLPADATFNNTTTPNTKVTAFHYTAGTANWQCVSATDNTHVTTTGSGVAVATGPVTLEIRYNVSNVSADFYINESLACQLTTNLISNTDHIQDLLFVSNKNTANAVVLGLSQVSWQSIN